MRRAAGPVDAWTPVSRAAKERVPVGCSGSQPEAPDRGKASTFNQAERRTARVLAAHQPYKLAEGLAKASGVGTPVLRFFVKSPGVAETTSGETTIRRFHQNAASTPAILRGYASKTRRIQWQIIFQKKNNFSASKCSVRDRRSEVSKEQSESTETPSCA